MVLAAIYHEALLWTCNVRLFRTSGKVVTIRMFQKDILMKIDIYDTMWQTIETLFGLGYIWKHENVTSTPFLDTILRLGQLRKKNSWTLARYNYSHVTIAFRRSSHFAVTLYKMKENLNPGCIYDCCPRRGAMQWRWKWNNNRSTSQPIRDSSLWNNHHRNISHRRMLMSITATTCFILSSKLINR